MKATTTNLANKLHEFATANYLPLKSWKRASLEELPPMINLARKSNLPNKSWLISDMNNILDQMAEKGSVRFCSKCSNWNIIRNRNFSCPHCYQEELKNKGN